MQHAFLAMPTRNYPHDRAELTPCRLPTEQWQRCTAEGCYLNYRCPVYCGSHPNPERDYIPLPPVFVRISRFQAIPVYYRLPGPLCDPDA